MSLHSTFLFLISNRSNNYIKFWNSWHPIGTGGKIVEINMKYMCSGLTPVLYWPYYAYRCNKGLFFQLKKATRNAFLSTPIYNWITKKRTTTRMAALVDKGTIIPVSALSVIQWMDTLRCAYIRYFLLSVNTKQNRRNAQWVSNQPTPTHIQQKRPAILLEQERRSFLLCVNKDE